jgi:single-strand DNA-binding protein
MDINRVILIGRLVRDPDTRLLPSGVPITTFRIAVNRRPSKEGTQNTDFIDIVAWRQLGDLCARYLKKGHRVAVEGSLRQRSWQDQNGNYQSKIEVVADNVQFLEPRGSQTSTATETFPEEEVTVEEQPKVSETGYEEVYRVLDGDLEIEDISELEDFNFEGGDSD